MIVLDASVVVELLSNGRLAPAIRNELKDFRDLVLVPFLLDVEVLSAFRRLSGMYRLDSHRMQQVLSALASLPVDRCAHLPLLDRVWELRHNFTSYDAVYIALAEATGATLYTLDAKLSKGHHAPVVVFSSPN